MKLEARIEHELASNILPFWLQYGIDSEFGGFRGQISNDLVIDPLADKGLILNTRILWTFSRVYSTYHEENILAEARRAYEYILEHFHDEQHGGFYWMVDYKGEPTDARKRIYGQAFSVYALTEYYRASGQKKALKLAIETYELIEKISHDNVNLGYFETYERDWTLAADQRLSEVDMDEQKSMNTHLHVLEAYASLLRGWENATLRQRLRELIAIFMQRIINPANHHLLMFFNEKWQPQSDHISYGHDIEASWLLVEAAEVLGDETVTREMKRESVSMAQAIYDQALDFDGGLLYEADSTRLLDGDKHWWPQAEAVVGFLSAYQISGQEHFLAAAQQVWEFIEKHIVDHENGEWFWKVSRDGIVSSDKYKVDPWKCPYHNTRACLEAIRRLGELQRLPSRTPVLKESR